MPKRVYKRINDEVVQVEGPPDSKNYLDCIECKGRGWIAVVMGDRIACEECKSSGRKSLSSPTVIIPKKHRSAG